MRLTRDVYLVGGGPTTGFGLSSGKDCHVYLLRGDDSLALVDCGLGTAQSIDLITQNIHEDGLDPSRIEQIFLTHYHADHSGGAAAWKEVAGAKVVAAAEAASALERGDQVATGFALAQDSGIYPADYTFRPCQVGDVLQAGDSRSVGHLSVEYVATPGHCNGHGCYRVAGGDRTYLFTGDCVFYGGRILLQNVADCDIQAYRESVLRLDTIPFDALLPGHGAIALTGGELHVKMAADAFRGLFLPPNLR